MKAREQHTCIQDHGQVKRSRAKKGFRFLLCFLLAAMLVLQVPMYGAAAPASGQEGAAGAASSGQEESTGTTPSDAAATEAEAEAEADGAVDDPSADANLSDEPEAVEELEAAQTEGAFATLSEAEEAGVIAAVPADPEAYVVDEIIVTLAGVRDESDERSLIMESLVELSLANQSAEVETLSSEVDGGALVLVKLPADVSVADALLQLANDENVAFAQPNFYYTLFDDELFDEGQAYSPDSSSEADLLYVPSDPLASNPSFNGYQWWLSTTKTFSAWDRQRAKGAVTVAVMDTGARLTHDDLDDNILQKLAWNADTQKPLTTAYGKNGDIQGHGTHVSGIIAAEADNGLLIAGISFNAKILPITIANADAKLSTSAIIRASDYIIKHRTDANIRVVNMSFGGYGSDSAFHNKVKQMRNQGILVIASAGNDNTSTPHYPSDWSEVVSVISVDKNNSRSYFSNYGSTKDIAAPGESIASTSYDNDQSGVFKSGTSMASPVVAGVAALLFARNSNLTPKQVEDAIYKSAIDLGTKGRDNYYGYGLVNARAALDYIDQTYPYTVTFNPNGGKVSPPSVKKTHGSQIGTLPKPTLTGYTFQGWYTAKTGGTKIATTTTVTKNITYYAHWKINTYTVTFNPNSGTVSPTSVKKTHGSQIGTLPTPTHASFSFAGWYTAATGGTKVATTTKVTKNVTYYAHWTCTITFNPNGGKVSPTSVKKTYGTAIGTLLTPTRTGYTFQGWYTAKTGGTKIATTTKVTKNATYYAQWKVNTYTVTFNPNGGVVSPTSVKKTYGSTIGTLPAPTRANYNFVGWYTAATGGTKIVTTTKVLKSVTYYARWTGKPYKVTFDANGGAVSPASVTKTYNTAIGTLPVPTRSGYVFNGWYTAKTGGTKIATTTKVLKPVTYYAQWAPNLNGKIVRISASAAPSRVFDIPGASKAAGVSPVLWDNAYRPNQRFKLILDSQGYYTIRNVNSGLVLDVSGGQARDGAAIVQWPASGGNNQKWRLLYNANGSYTIVSKLNESFCLDLPAGSTANNTKPILWPKRADLARQQFFLYDSKALADGTYTIASTASPKLYVDIKGASRSDGAPALLWTATGKINQKFKLTYNTTTGYYSIVSANSNKALDVSGASTSPGAPVIQWAPTGAYNQQWVVAPDGKGNCTIYSASSGLVLDAKGGANNGSSLIVWNSTGGSNQKWVLKKS